MRYFCIKDVILSDHSPSILWFLCCRSLENYCDFSKAMTKKAYITVFGRVEKYHIRFYDLAESDMIFLMIIPMSACCFQPGVNLIKCYTLVGRREFAKPITKFFIAVSPQPFRCSFLDLWFQNCNYPYLIIVYCQIFKQVEVC